MRQARRLGQHTGRREIRKMLTLGPAASATRFRISIYAVRPHKCFCCSRVKTELTAGSSAQSCLHTGELVQCLAVKWEYVQNISEHIVVAITLPRLWCEEVLCFCGNLTSSCRVWNSCGDMRLGHLSDFGKVLDDEA